MREIPAGSAKHPELALFHEHHRHAFQDRTHCAFVEKTCVKITVQQVMLDPLQDAPGQIHAAAWPASVASTTAPCAVGMYTAAPRPVPGPTISIGAPATPSRAGVSGNRSPGFRYGVACAAASKSLTNSSERKPTSARVASSTT